MSEGFYWVKIYDEWTIAQLILRNRLKSAQFEWFTIGYEVPLAFEQITIIGPKIQEYTDS